MIKVVISQDDKVLKEIDCRSICLSYDDGNTIVPAIISEPSVPVLSLSAMGCCAASACFDVIKEYQDTEDSKESENSNKYAIDDSVQTEVIPTDKAYDTVVDLISEVE